MSGKVTVQTPTDKSQAIELGRTTWRKQILPVGELPYKGRRLNFDRKYLDNIVTAFREGAYDTVPFQLAGDDNSHTNAVDRAAGEIIGLDATDEGLFATVSVTDKGAEILRDNPKLPVSVRVVEEYERNDGKSTKRYGAALQHVLATWAPRVAGMTPWQAVDCADETDEVLDLSALTFTPEGDIKQEDAASAVSGEEAPHKEMVNMPPIPADQQEALRALFKQWQEEESKATEAPQSAPQPAEFKEQPKAEEPEAAEAEELEPIAASDDEAKSVDLAQVELATKLDAQAVELAELRAERDAEKWRYEGEELVREYGISPAIVKLAEPLLKGTRKTVELAEGGSVDAGQVLRDVLHTVAKTYGKAVDLSGPVGTAKEVAASDAEREDRDSFLAAQRATGFAR